MNLLCYDFWCRQVYLNRRILRLRLFGFMTLLGRRGRGFGLVGQGDLRELG